MAGSRNKLTVIDIDARGAEGERLLADVQREVGDARFIVRTGGGGFHAYYRHNGEGRKIRLDPRRPIDLLGGGQIVLPPSRGSKAHYEIIHGSLDDLTALTPIRTPVVPLRPVIETEQQGVVFNTTPAPLAAMGPHSGRNSALFDILRKEARQLPQTLDAFIDRARQVNQTFGEPMIDFRVINTAKSVFGYLETGELRTGEHGAWFKKPQVRALAREPYLFSRDRMAESRKWTRRRILGRQWPGGSPSRMANRSATRGTQPRHRTRLDRNDRPTRKRTKRPLSLGTNRQNRHG
jgi:hypothetical protein